MKKSKHDEENIFLDTNEINGKVISEVNEKKVKALTEAIRLTIQEKDLSYFKSLTSFIPKEKFWDNGLVALERDLGAIWLERFDDGLTVIYKALILRKPIDKN